MGGPGSGKKPRDYPPEIVRLICGMYEAGMTVAEIRECAPKGYRVQTVLERYLPQRRVAAKRDQSGERNHSWKGDGARYSSLHLRVAVARGKPQYCAACDRTDSEVRYEWANLTGRYDDIHDYVRLCVPCHRRTDQRLRYLIGGPLSAHVRR